MQNHRHRIVLTGGPGGGKTTAADLMRREVGEQIVIVPEAATMLFSGGFPRHDQVHARRSAQQAIYHVQQNLEDVHSALYPERLLLCDRGTLDREVIPNGPSRWHKLLSLTAVCSRSGSNIPTITLSATSNLSFASYK